jgi:SagB-type dehydrogenase family enzyme
LRQSRLFAGNLNKTIERSRGKRYPRFPELALPEATAANDSLSYAFAHRHSARDTDFTGKPLTLREISLLLAGVRARENKKRPYPSGGGLYPIETYVLSTIEKKNTVYHYAPENHSLENLWPLPSGVNLQTLTGTQNKLSPFPSTFFIMTSVWERSHEEYGDFAYDLCLLEAGHLVQNVLLAAATLSLAARPIGGFSDTLVEELLDIRSTEEQAVYVIALG